MIIDEKKGKSVNTMTLSQREAMINSLEAERLDVVGKIEAVSCSASKLNVVLL